MKSLRVCCLFLLSLVLLGLAAPTAQAQARAASLSVQITVNPDGSLDVRESMTFDAAPGTVTRAIALTRDVDPGSYHRLTVTGLSATVAGGVAPSSKEEGDAVVVTAQVDAPGTVDLSYRVTGATSPGVGPDGPLAVVTWPALEGWSVGVEKVDVAVTGPGVQTMDCVAGPVGSIGTCAMTSGGTFDNPDPAFQDGPREAGDEVVVEIGYAPSEVAVDADLMHRWSLDRAFEVSWPTVLPALLVALVGGLALLALFRRTGLDVTGTDTTTVATFTPVGDGEAAFQVHDAIRPGHVGTVSDERVDPLDITATLLDLAVRGHLLITELPRAPHGLLDWTLERRAGRDELVAFEAELLDLVAPEGTATRVSELPHGLTGGIGRVQDALYDDVVQRGWFASRPDATRSSWRVRGWGALAVATLAAVALVAWTRLGLLALVLLGLAAALLWVADRMPRRTAAGSALLRGLSALAGVLATQPTGQLPRGRELAEGSKVLGYCVVLGGKERWIEALVAADDDEASPDPDALDWYHAPATWHLQDLPASLTQFVHTVQGELFGR